MLVMELQKKIKKEEPLVMELYERKEKMKGFYRVANEHWKGWIANGVAKEPKKRKKTWMAHWKKPRPSQRKSITSMEKSQDHHERKIKWAWRE